MRYGRCVKKNRTKIESNLLVNNSGLMFSRIHIIYIRDQIVNVILCTIHKLITTEKLDRKNEFYFC